MAANPYEVDILVISSDNSTFDSIKIMSHFPPQPPGPQSMRSFITNQVIIDSIFSLTVGLLYTPQRFNQDHRRTLPCSILRLTVMNLELTVIKKSSVIQNLQSRTEPFYYGIAFTALQNEEDSR